MKEFTSAVVDTVTEDGEAVEEKYAEFKLDGRTMRAYYPTDGQLVYMLSGLGRGQSNDSRFASIVNVMVSSLREDDKDYFEGRLLTRDPKQRLDPALIEEIFASLMEEWFGNPTQP